MGNACCKPLSKDQVETLTKNGCSAEDWARVLADEGFDPARIERVKFHGEIRLGRFDGEVDTPHGRRKAGICSATLRNVELGDDCFIANVHGSLSNLRIGAGAVIENVGAVACAGKTSFGNGHEIAVMNEGGGRELKLTSQTSSQIAYLTVLYRHNRKLTERLNLIADRYARGVTAGEAPVGSGAWICNCGEIVDVAIGPHARIIGPASLRSGTVDSSSDAPTLVGHGVIARDFIFQRGSSIQDGAMVCGSLIGEGTQIGRQFSCENSVFFANSEGFHSEACSVFGGPYTVTHHRSTLLIAGLFSFYNAGSGTNESNHMYKLGPLHQGVLERGCKTGSFSYLLWPCRVGAFSVVLGKHSANFDASDLPFSYVDAVDGKTTIVPGMNFFTVGTLRDGEKWPARDRRKGARKLDLVVFDVLSPYTAQKMIRAREILARLHSGSEKGQEYVSCNGAHIKRLLLSTCGRYYKLALDKYLGDVLARRIDARKGASARELLAPRGNTEHGPGEWIDAAGLICPKSRIDKLAAAVESGGIEDMEALHEAFRNIYDSVRDDEWNWFIANRARVPGGDLPQDQESELRAILDNWKQASLKLLNMVLSDAAKEFDPTAKTGYGIDGECDADFDAVRGSFDANKFTVRLKKDIDQVNARHESLVAMLR